MKLDDLFTTHCTRAKVKCASKKRAIELISELVANGGKPSQINAILERIVKRERLGSTVIGNGVALPHARIAQLTKPMIALLQLQSPLLFDDQHSPVDLIFALLVPEETNQQYLNFLSQLAERLRDSDYLTRLRTCKTSEELYTTATSYQHD